MRAAASSHGVYGPCGGAPTRRDAKNIPKPRTYRVTFAGDGVVFAGPARARIELKPLR